MKKLFFIACFFLLFVCIENTCKPNDKLQAHFNEIVKKISSDELSLFDLLFYLYQEPDLFYLKDENGFNLLSHVYKNPVSDQSGFLINLKKDLSNIFILLELITKKKEQIFQDELEKILNETIFPLESQPKTNMMIKLNYKDIKDLINLKK